MGQYGDILDHKPMSRVSVPLPFQKGMSFSAEGGAQTGYLSEAARASLDQLKAMGVRWISLMPFAFSSVREGAERLTFEPRNSWESDDSLRKAAYEVHLRGMEVFMKPHVWTRKASTVDLEITDSRRWQTWFSSYRRYILHQARLAAEIGAGMFALGNELGRLTLDPSHESDWRRLAVDVRRLYPGVVTYCANWGEEYEKLRFADTLDVLGVNAYYPLANRPDASFEELQAGARSVVQRIQKVSDRTGRCVVITEVGFPAISSSTVGPWQEEQGSAVSLEAQETAMEALVEVVQPRQRRRPLRSQLYATR